MKDSKILAEARELIKDPRSWTKGASWRKTDGLDSFCVSGAIGRAMGWDGLATNPELSWRWMNVICALDPLAKEMEPEVGKTVSPTVALNDMRDTRHEDIMALLDKGIAKLEEEGR